MRLLPPPGGISNSFSVFLNAIFTLSMGNSDSAQTTPRASLVPLTHLIFGRFLFLTTNWKRMPPLFLQVPRSPNPHSCLQNTCANFTHGFCTVSPASVILECIFVQIVVILSTSTKTPPTGISSQTSSISLPQLSSICCLYIHPHRPATRSIQLDLLQVQALHHTFTRERYRAWQHAAPSSWQDPFFRTRIPLIVASRYGQDELLSFSSHAAEQLQERMRWKDLASISFALATDVEYVFSLCVLSPTNELAPGHAKGS